MKLTFGKLGNNVVIGAAFAAVMLGLGIGQAVLQNKADAQVRTVQAPMFEVDPLWPKPLPNHWVLGATIGVWVDSDDHVWIIHRSSSTLANNEKALELKTSQLIAFGILLNNLSHAAVNHGCAALRAGATEEELHAVAEMAFLFRGLPAINFAEEAIAGALEAYNKQK